MSRIEFIDWVETNQLAVSNKCKFACYVRGEGDEFKILVKEVKERYPLAEHHVLIGAIVVGGIFFFDTVDELDKFYDMFMVDGLYGSGIYACTYSPDGQMITENT